MLISWYLNNSPVTAVAGKHDRIKTFNLFQQCTWMRSCGLTYCTWPCWGWPAVPWGTAAASWCPPWPGPWPLGPCSETDHHPGRRHRLEGREAERDGEMSGGQKEKGGRREMSETFPPMTDISIHRAVLLAWLKDRWQEHCFYPTEGFPGLWSESWRKPDLSRSSGSSLRSGWPPLPDTNTHTQTLIYIWQTETLNDLTL